YNYSESYLRGRIVGALGGRAAEELVYGDRTTGAHNDLQQVTRMAYDMVTKWGMSDAIGPVALAPEGGQFLGGDGGLPRSKPYSEATAEAIDAAARRIIEERSEEHTSELQSREKLVCRLLLEKKKKKRNPGDNTETRPT